MNAETPSEIQLIMLVVIIIIIIMFHCRNASFSRRSSFVAAFPHLCCIFHYRFLLQIAAWNGNILQVCWRQNQEALVRFRLRWDPHQHNDELIQSADLKAPRPNVLVRASPRLVGRASLSIKVHARPRTRTHVLAPLPALPLAPRLVGSSNFLHTRIFQRFHKRRRLISARVHFLT